MTRPPRYWIVGLAVLAACSYNRSELDPPPTKALDGGIDQQPGWVDGKSDLADTPSAVLDAGPKASGVDGLIDRTDSMSDVPITTGQDSPSAEGGVGGVGSGGTGGNLGKTGGAGGTGGTGGVGTGGTTGIGGSTTPDASCVIPAAPSSVVAIRSGNRRVTLTWTTSAGASSYKVLRSTMSSSVYSSVGTSSGTPYMDTTVENGVAYYYVVTAASDADGNCASARSAEAPVVACVNLARVNGIAEVTHFNTTNAYCVVTCDDIGTWQVFNLRSRRLFINEVDRTGQVGLNLPASLLPAKVNGGYAFYFTAGEADTGMNWWDGAAGTCP